MNTLGVSRRRFLTGTAALADVELADANLQFPFFPFCLGSRDHTSADYTLHIKSSPIEIAPRRIVSEITYNGQFPGPCFVSKKGGRSPSIFTMTRTLRNNCIGTVKRFR